MGLDVIEQAVVPVEAAGLIGGPGFIRSQFLNHVMGLLGEHFGRVLGLEQLKRTVPVHQHTAGRDSNQDRGK